MALGGTLTLTHESLLHVMRDVCRSAGSAGGTTYGTGTQSAQTGFAGNDRGNAELDLNRGLTYKADEQHPFHLHTYPMQVISVNGVPVPFDGYQR